MFGWYSEKSIGLKKSWISDRKGNKVKLPKTYKYLDVNGNIVMVTHITRTIETKPNYDDCVCVGKITNCVEYLKL